MGDIREHLGIRNLRKVVRLITAHCLGLLGFAGPMPKDEPIDPYRPSILNAKSGYLLRVLVDVRTAEFQVADIRPQAGFFREFTDCSRFNAAVFFLESSSDSVSFSQTYAALPYSERVLIVAEQQNSGTPNFSGWYANRIHAPRIA